MVLVAVRVEVAKGLAKRNAVDDVDGEVLDFVTEIERLCESWGRYVFGTDEVNELLNAKVDRGFEFKVLLA